MDFKEVRRLKDKIVKEGEHWIFSAGFDVNLDLKPIKRIDAEIDDIKYISDSGGIVSILSHQGRYEDKNTFHLDYVASYLSKKLNREVKYFPENSTLAAVEFANSLEAGEIAVLGNSRFNEGESKNDKNLSKQYSKLGDYVVVGGIAKAHRNHSSNVGILDYLPGFLSTSLERNMSFLSPWSEKSENYSVAILGGTKKEKILTGLKGLSKKYHAIIPSGIVLNNILKTKGYMVGKSLVGEYGKSFEKETLEILKDSDAKILLPEKIIISRKTEERYTDVSAINIEEVPEDYMIVDFILSDSARNNLERAINEKGRILLAGTPTLHTKGFKNGTTECVKYMEKPQVRSIILGGDSSKEIEFSGLKFPGGGSSLEYICTGTLAVYEALKLNKQKFKI